MIEKYPHKYCLQDEYGYTDKDLVDKLNEVIEVVNTIAYKNNECSNDCRTANQTNADRIRNMSDEELGDLLQSVNSGAENGNPFISLCVDDNEITMNFSDIYEWLQLKAE